MSLKQFIKWAQKPKNYFNYVESGKKWLESMSATKKAKKSAKA